MERLRNVDLNLLVVLDALLAQSGVTPAAKVLRLSPPATSHALARLRETFDDPLLVRAGRRMVLTPRAQALRPHLVRLMEDTRRLLASGEDLDPRELDRTYSIHATDHILTVLGPAFDARAHAAPKVRLTFLPNRPDDVDVLGRGGIDLALGVYHRVPAEIHRETLFHDEFVCVVRRDHPSVRKKISIKRFVELEHVLVAPRGRPGSAVDAALKGLGLQRRVARRFPYFLQALLLVSQTDYAITISRRIGEQMADSMSLRVLSHPLPLKPYPIHMIWHARSNFDGGHRWLRNAALMAARDIGKIKKRRS